MIDPKQLSIFVGFGTLLFILWQRHRILNLSCMGIFFLSHVVFVLIGLLAIPWLIEGYLVESYSSVDFSLIDQSDIINTIILVIAGLALVFIGNVFVEMITFFMTGRPEHDNRGRLLWTVEPIDLYIRRNVIKARLKYFFIAALILTLILLNADWTSILEGIRYSYFMFDVEAFYKARSEVGSAGRLYFILVFNVLPFLSITFWMFTRIEKGAGNKAWALFMITMSAILLLLTFQKRPLLIYLITLFASEILARMATGYSVISIKATNILSIIGTYWKRISFYLTIVFLVALGFFHISTNIEDFRNLAIVVIDRIFTRLALMPVFYVHYFPNVEPHYGFTNIGILSSLLGFEKYADTVVTDSYFSKVAESVGGSGAIGALVDFYGAWGWPGFVLCCFCLGMLLRFLDKWLSSLPSTFLNKSLYIFMLVFVYYLSQASFFRSLSSYGGLTFLTLWFLLKTKLVPMKSKTQV
jgi:hypothetical protein